MPASAPEPNDAPSGPLVQLSLSPSPRSAEPIGDKLSLAITGMHCAGCVHRVEQALNSVRGVNTSRVNLVTNEATVWRDAKLASIGDLAAAVERAGYHAAPIDSTSDHHALADQLDTQTLVWRRRFIIGLALLMPLMVVHYAAPHGSTWLNNLTTVAYLVLYGYLGWPYLREAAKLARHASANMDTLVAMGTTTAVLAGLAELYRHGHTMYLMDAGMILVFITLGKWLEALARGRASQAIRRLLDLTPENARVVRDGQTESVPVASVRVGETIIVAPGERVPLDAKVSQGASAVDESWLTGESLPVDKQPGSTILTGTINGDGSLTAAVLRAAGESTLDRVVQLVREAQSSRPPIERLADTIVARFVPAVLLIAAVTLLAWGMFTGQWDAGVSAAVAVLVVACPCAMGLATPVAVLVASGVGAEHGLLIKDAAALEMLSRVDTIVLDKTGTVTLGNPQLIAVEPVAGMAADELLGLAASVERLSTHPLGRPIIEAAESQQLATPTTSNLQVVAGQGVVAQCGGRRVLVGNEKLLTDAGLDLAAIRPQLDKHRQHAGTVLLVATDRLLGLLVVADTIAPGSRAAIDALQRQNLELLLVSGDHRTTVEAVARQVGIERVHAEALPQDKVAIVNNLRAAGKRVALVGDGINDAPAMAAADVGIAVGSGADVAIEAAQIVLVQVGLSGVVSALRLSQHTLAIIRQNLAWAFGYNLVLLPLAAGVGIPLLGWSLPPVAASVAMAASSVSVVANSLRLRRLKLDRPSSNA